MPPKIEAIVKLTTLWIRDLVDDWVTVKWELINELNNDERKLFSRRDPQTKEQPPYNEMESEIVALWRRLTGVQLVNRKRCERHDLTWWEPSPDKKIHYRRRHKSGRGRR